MDGTLLDCKARISQENQRAIERFVEGGGMFTVATGRMNKAVEPYLQVLPLSIPAIVYNGAAIYDFTAKKFLWEKFLPENLENVVAKIQEQFPEAGIEVFPESGIYLVKQNKYVEQHVKREGFNPIISDLKSVPKPWFKVLIACAPERLAEIEEFLGGMEEEFHAVYSEPQFLELINSKVSKGDAIKRLSAMLNYPCESIVAMGDNKNDIEMLRTVGTGIAVANAHETVSEVADMTCSHHDHDAVAEVIGWIEDGTLQCHAAV